MTVQEMSPFRLLKQSQNGRTGILSFPNSSKSPLKTPAFLTTTSKGAVPHVTPDNLRFLKLNSFHISAEDFSEKSPAPSWLMEYPDDVRELLCLPVNQPLVMSPRRSMPVPCAQPNTDKTIAIVSSEGIRHLAVDQFYDLVYKVKPDLLYCPVDIPNLLPGHFRPGGNRVRKLIIRSEDWFKQFDSTKTPDTLICAGVPPGLDNDTVQLIVDDLPQAKIAGITFWNTEGSRISQALAKSTVGKNATTPLPKNPLQGLDIPDNLVRCWASSCKTPQDVLELVAYGFDVVYGDLASYFADAGIALDFEFGGSETATDKRDIGLNLWDPIYKVDMTSVYEGHYRAYLHHLLNAREMTAWVVLQMNNLQVLNNFFDSIRKSIDEGSFSTDHAKFLEIYGDANAAVEFRERFLTKESTPYARGYKTRFEDEVVRLKIGSGGLNEPPFQKL